MRDGRVNTPTISSPLRSGAAATVALALAAAPSVAHAQRAAYVRPDELPREGVSHQLDLSTRLGYARVLDPARVGGMTNQGAFSLRLRALVGRTVAWTGGLDAEVGGAETGVIYGATLHALGLAARWGRGSYVSLSGGAGLSGAPGAVPFAFRFPAELSVAVSLGPVRLGAWASVAWTPTEDARAKGSPTLSLVDECEAGVSLRIGRQRRFWGTVNAGRGPSINVAYREFMGARSLGVMIGFDLSGAR